MTECEELRESIALLAGGLADEREKQGLQAHLRSCTACRAYYETMRTLCENLRGLARETANAPLPVGLHERVRQAIMTEKQPSDERRPRLPLLYQWRPLFRRSLAWASVAAAACVVIGVAIWHHRAQVPGRVRHGMTAGSTGDRHIETTAAALFQDNALPSYVVYRRALNDSAEKLDLLLNHHDAAWLRGTGIQTGSELRNLRGLRKRGT